MENELQIACTWMSLVADPIVKLYHIVDGVAHAALLGVVSIPIEHLFTNNQAITK